MYTGKAYKDFTRKRFCSDKTVYVPSAESFHDLV